MRLTSKNQTGIAVVEILLVVAVVLIVGAVIVKVRSTQSNSNPTPVATEKSNSADIKEAKSDADLQALDAQIGKQNLDTPTADETSLDSDSSSF